MAAYCGMMLVFCADMLFSIDFFFFFNDTATTEIYTLSLHDALPIRSKSPPRSSRWVNASWSSASTRSEEHTSELQSRSDLVCRLLLEKKKRSIGESRYGADAGASASQSLNNTER